MMLDELAYHALVVVVQTFRAHGIRPNLPMCASWEANVRRMVDVGKAPNALDGARALADDLLKCRVERFAELTERSLDPKIATKIITDTVSGICIRVVMSNDGIVFNAEGIGVPTLRHDS